MGTSRDRNFNKGPGNFSVTNIGHDLVQNFTTTVNPHKTLWNRVASVGASHTSEQQYSRGQCLDGTREEVLRVIREWILSKDPSFPICWLSGTAGVGKSSIAMTVAKYCEKDELVASFFFFKSDPMRNNPSVLVLTIALGLVENIPSHRAFINGKISERPTILEAKVEDQFQELVLKPTLRRKWRRRFRKFLARFSLAPQHPTLVIIDGLDECSDEETQLRILSTISSSYQRSSSAWPPLKFLICSRPEAWIREAFDAPDLSRMTHRVVLDDAFHPDQDIEKYLLHEFGTIRASPKYSRLPFPSPWPSVEELQHLVQDSSGQFVYAVTAVKFVKLAYSNPLDQLRTILDYAPGNQTSDSPFPELDRLYHIIMSVNPNREKLLSILAAIFLVRGYVSPSPEFIESLLGFTTGEVDLALRVMHSVLNIRGGGDEISVFHTSFRDYLFDRGRSGIFFIDQPAQTHFLATQWLQHLSSKILRQYSFQQVLEPERGPLPELLADLQNVELNTVLLCLEESHTGWETPSFPTWDETFNGLVSWLEKLATWTLDPTAVDRFKNQPKRFHLESEEDHVKFDYLEHAVILKLNHYGSWYSLSSMVAPPSFRVTDCRCNEANLHRAPPPRSHERYEEACLRAVKALVLEASIHHSGRTEWIRVFENLVDSSLLQHCAFGSELFAQCQKLFSSPSKDPFPGVLDWQNMPQMEERRVKLMDWLDTCPRRYASEAKALKLQIASIFKSRRLVAQQGLQSA
ncbi:hypothetical protein PQX77_010948 [Marasmius sp. AFHP31]|nr:hypothetical protein PQX77_010948 [Marasmius sp. AFHP31]